MVSGIVEEVGKSDYQKCGGEKELKRREEEEKQDEEEE